MPVLQHNKPTNRCQGKNTGSLARELQPKQALMADHVDADENVSSAKTGSASNEKWSGYQACTIIERESHRLLGLNVPLTRQFQLFISPSIGFGLTQIVCRQKLFYF
ncbi:hypothetical protein G3M48_001335 [Beauveria asiatica]|uniref:Uncharacterized protein n=1 Tax=Beauveria asiatica TaxID=1069075 RepID=A0AAW0S005_9HYPO